jgi:50S ribosomal protein L16 3-hydroxylase
MDGLDLLLQPVGRDAFRREHWPDRPLVLHGRAERFAANRLLETMVAVEDVFSVRKRHVQTQFGEEGHEFEFSRLVDGASARSAWAQGAALRLTPFEEYSPAAAELKRDIADAFAIPATAIRVNAFYMRDGGGLPRHFDGREVFNVQLAGKRSWTIERNEAVDYPDVPMLPGCPQRGDDLLATIWKEPPPSTFGTAAESFDMEPGSVVFLPRGTWHRTTSRGYSVSLSIGCQTPTRYNLLLRALGAEARRDPALRAPVGARTSAPSGEVLDALRRRIDEAGRE